MNHDTQPHQALEAPISAWFKPLAYALILLRNSGYPCIFYGDLYGIVSPDSGSSQSSSVPKLESQPSCSGILPLLALSRKLYAYGEQASYFDYPTCVGFVRYGTWDRPFGCAVVMSNAGPGTKRMHVGEMHAAEKWTDVLGWSQGEVIIGHDGFGEFTCGGCSVSVWVNSKAEGRDKFNKDEL